MRRYLIAAGVAAWIVTGAWVRAGSGPTSRPAVSALSLEALGKGFGPLVENLPAGRINWTRGEIIARGLGRAGSGKQTDVDAAEQAARFVAATNASLLMRGIEPGPAGQFGDIRRDQLTAEGVLKDFKEIAVRFDPNTRVATALLRVPFHGREGMVAMRHVILTLPPERWHPPAGKPTAERIDAIAVDARGLKLMPCVYPRLSTATGQCLLEGTWLRRDEPTRLNRPLYVTYGPEPGKPKPLPARLPFADGRHHALVLKAARVDPKSSCTLILDDQTVQTLARDAGAQALLDLGEVIIITDP